MSKAKFQNKFTAHQTESSASSAAPKAVLPIAPKPGLPAHQYPTTPTTPPPTAPEQEPALVQVNNPIGAELEDIMSEDPLNRDKDKPNTKYQDTDFAKNPAMVGGMRVIQTDALARALNAECYLLDVAKPWGTNPLGGRPVAVNFTREFPGKGILYDNFDTSPETSTKEKVNKLVTFKAKLANANGFIYLYQTPWCVLTTNELDKQLAAQKELLKKK